MRRRIWTTGWAAILGSACALGCQANSSRAPYPADPLLVSKKPVEDPTPSGADPVLIASAEPAKPSLPGPVLAMAPRGGDVPQRPFALASQPRPIAPDTPRGTVAAVPAVRSSAASPLGAIPAVRRQVAGTYGHAEDYTWLQGVLDRHYDGHLDLRYCDPTTEDQWGGKVCLEKDVRLAQMHEGDVVFVEGAILPPGLGAQASSYGNYPRYRITNIWVVRRKGN